MSQITFEHLMHALGEDPWQALELSRAQHHSSRRREWEIAAVAFAFALWLRERPCEVQQLYLKPFFGHGYRPNPKHLLLHVLQFQRDDRHGEDSDRAQVQAAALRGAYDAGWTAEQVLAALVERGGFAPLRRWFCQQYEDAGEGDDLREVEDDRRQLGLTPMPAATAHGYDASGCDPAPDEDEFSIDGGEEDQCPATSISGKPAAGAAGVRSQRYADGTEGLLPLEVLSKPHLFGEAMQLEEDEFFDVRIRRTKNGSLRYRRFEATRLGPARPQAVGESTARARSSSAFTAVVPCARLTGPVGGLLRRGCRSTSTADEVHPRGAGAPARRHPPRAAARAAGLHRRDR